ncbi:MAG: hypothetical protein FWD14_05710 [Treponema sp.]|nr:hypothetical protein [Treponema sp.]
MIKISFLLFFYVLNFSIFTNYANAQTSADAELAARDALRRLEIVLSGGADQGSQRANTTPSVPAPPAQVTRGGSQPRWTNDPYAVYPREHFIAVTGIGTNRSDAERRALAALAAFFGQSIQADFSTTTIYAEAVNRGTVNVSQNTNVRAQIITAASMDNLIGAEIGNIWDDGRGTVYAVAFLDKAKTVSIYTDMIILNNQNITLLTAISNAEKNTFNGLARFRLASGIAGINTNYVSVVSMAGGSTASFNLRNADFYNLEALNIIRNISVGFNVRGDQNNRVRDAFAGVLNSEGLRTQGVNSPYILEININMNEVRPANSDFVFCNFTVNANLIERATGSVLLPFSYSDREGHMNYEEAQTRAIFFIERTIAERYPAVFREFLTSLIPNR